MASRDQGRAGLLRTDGRRSRTAIEAPRKDYPLRRLSPHRGMSVYRREILLPEVVQCQILGDPEQKRPRRNDIAGRRRVSRIKRMGSRPEHTSEISATDLAGSFSAQLSQLLLSKCGRRTSDGPLEEMAKGEGIAESKRLGDVGYPDLFSRQHTFRFQNTESFYVMGEAGAHLQLKDLRAVLLRISKKICEPFQGEAFLEIHRDKSLNTVRERVLPLGRVAHRWKRLDNRLAVRTFGGTAPLNPSFVLMFPPVPPGETGWCCVSLLLFGMGDSGVYRFDLHVGSRAIKMPTIESTWALGIEFLGPPQIHTCGRVYFDFASQYHGRNRCVNPAYRAHPNNEGSRPLTP